MAFEHSGAPAPYEVSDARALRAMAHPVRLALIEALTDAGRLTATEAAERIGESPASCSFHLRQLAKYGFVEEAERGPGRRRSWRRTHVSMHFRLEHEDRETAAAAETLSDVLLSRYIERARRAAARRRFEPPEWLAVTGQSEFTLYVTPDELRALDDDVTAVLRRFQERIADRDARPEGSRPIEVLLFAHPIDS